MALGCLATTLDLGSQPPTHKRNPYTTRWVLATQHYRVQDPTTYSARVLTTPEHRVAVPSLFYFTPRQPPWFANLINIFVWICLLLLFRRTKWVILIVVCARNNIHLFDQFCFQPLYIPRYLFILILSTQLLHPTIYRNLQLIVRFLLDSSFKNQRWLNDVTSSLQSTFNIYEFSVNSLNAFIPFNHQKFYIRNLLPSMQTSSMRNLLPFVIASFSLLRHFPWTDRLTSHLPRLSPLGCLGLTNIFTCHLSSLPGVDTSTPGLAVPPIGLSAPNS